MGEKYTPVKGDRVRVVLEGEVTDTTTRSLFMGLDAEANAIVYGAEHVVSVEKIEPPVEMFKPGDVVRDLTGEGHPLIALSDKGFTNLNEGEFFRYGQDNFYLRAEAFTSDRFERVTLS